MSLNLINRIKDFISTLAEDIATINKGVDEVRNLAEGRFSWELDDLDSEGSYRTVTYKRSDGTLYQKSTLSGGTAPNYTTRTVIFYEQNGVTIKYTRIYALSYDTAGNLIAESITN